MKLTSPLFSVANKKFNIVVLAAGVGNRLKPETDHIPKALIELGGLRAIDYIILKYQHLVGSFIIAVGYCADLLQNYVRGRYPTLNFFFSHEEVADLKGPGDSLVYALDYASSRNPTIVTFCDYVVHDLFSVDHDCIGICKPMGSDFIYGTYATRAVVDEGVVIDLISNDDLENIKENGFTGIGIFHDTQLLKSLVYSEAASRSNKPFLDYAFDVVKPYLKKINTVACPLSQLYEFGTGKLLKQTREIFNARR